MATSGNLPPAKEGPIEPKTLIRGQLSTDRGEISYECKEQETKSLLSTEEGTQEAKFSGEHPSFKAKPTSFSARTAMVLWTSFGLAVAISHHLLCRYLNGLPVQNHIQIKKESITYQQMASAAGNAMTNAVQTSFKAAIGIFFVQQFWSQIRRHSFSAKKINTVIDVANQPLFFSSSFYSLFLSSLPL